MFCEIELDLDCQTFVCFCPRDVSVKKRKDKNNWILLALFKFLETKEKSTQLHTALTWGSHKPGLQKSFLVD